HENLFVSWDEITTPFKIKKHAGHPLNIDYYILSRKLWWDNGAGGGRRAMRQEKEKEGSPFHSGQGSMEEN
ncbi:hypothetical protein, partial [uncultured Desulfovibrio sp.]